MNPTMSRDFIGFAVILLAITCLSLQSFPPPWSAAAATERESSDQLRSAYAELTFNAALDGCELIPASHPRHLGLFDSSELLRSNLTEAEQRLTGTFVRPGGSRVSCAQSIGFVLIFYERFGRVPRDGIDMLGLYTDKWYTAEGQTEFIRLADSDAIWDTAACRCVNPATGKLFSSYSARVWEPFGLLVEPIRGKEGIKEIPAPAWDEQTGRWVSGLVPHQMWRVRVYGERPFTVLIDKEIGQRLDRGKKLSSGKCGCS